MPDEEEGIITKDKPKKGATARGFKRVREPQKPGKFAVALYNDDFTPMEFVTWILETVFHKNVPDAESIMLEVHKKGQGIAGVYTYEIAEQKVWDTLESAKENQFPLQCSAEPV